MTVIEPPTTPPPAPVEEPLTIEGTIEPPVPPPAPPADPGPSFTKDDIEKARREEKDKLYGSIDEMKKELSALRKAREDQAKAEEAARKKAEDDLVKAQAEAKRKAEEEMSVKELLAQKESEWEGRFKQIEEDNARKEELLTKERRYNELVAYRAARLEDEADTIIPEMRHLIALGNSEAEIDASIAAYQDVSSKIIAQVTAGQAAARQQQRGTTTTAPPVGPLESQPEFQSLSNDDLKSMDIATYAKNRDRLLGAVSQRVRSQGPYGG